MKFYFGISATSITSLQRLSLPVFISFYLCISLSVFLFIYLFLNLSFILFIYLFIYFCIVLFICLWILKNPYLPLIYVFLFYFRKEFFHICYCFMRIFGLKKKKKRNASQELIKKSFIARPLEFQYSINKSMLQY